MRDSQKGEVMDEEQPEPPGREDKPDGADLPPVIVSGGLRLPPMGVRT
jgi:hypothetical protein